MKLIIINFYKGIKKILDSLILIHKKINYSECTKVTKRHSKLTAKLTQGKFSNNQVQNKAKMFITFLDI